MTVSFSVVPDRVPTTITPPRVRKLSLVALLIAEAYPGLATALLIGVAVLPGAIPVPFMLFVVPAALPGIGWLLTREFGVGVLVTAGHALIRLALFAGLALAAFGAFTDYDERDHPCDGYLTAEAYHECQRPYRVAYGGLAALAIAMPVSSAVLLAWSRDETST